MTRVLSGIKPTGQLTLGNYIGALRRFPLYQDQNETFVFIADLHALTLPIEPDVLRSNSRDIVAFYLAAGLDPKKTTIFLQSQVPQHAELNAILQNYIYMGELARMTQYKEKAQTQNESGLGLGLFAYPVLMAADILLYDAAIVPVGEDQIQHVELSRDIVRRFNNRYGDLLVMPEAKVATGARIMSLSDPTKKMSKSDPKGDVFLKDDPKTIRKKIMASVTDSLNQVAYDPDHQPGISNLLTIYASLKDIPVGEAATKFAGFQYGAFKTAVADAVLEALEPLQARYRALIDSPELDQVLAEGAKKAAAIAKKTLTKVQRAVGLL
ncbi:MAG: tryptophan--tRNA ligase [Bacilli bacterium]